MNIAILPSALEDIRNGAEFYEGQQEGLGAVFTEWIISEVESLKELAGVHSIHFDRFHRKLTRRFQCAVYYRIEGSQANVYAVIDCRRSPAWIESRLRGTPPRN